VIVHFLTHLCYSEETTGCVHAVWLTGLTPQIEYGYQYLVDESILVADPFAEKILDPEDSGIPTASYPDLKPYPAEALAAEWYFN